MLACSQHIQSTAIMSTLFYRTLAPVEEVNIKRTVGLAVILIAFAGCATGHNPKGLTIVFSLESAAGLNGPRACVRQLPHFDAGVTDKAGMLIAALPVLSRGMIAKVSEDWIICSTQETAKRLSIYVKEGDQYGIDGIISHGLGVNVGEGTRVKIVDTVSGYFEVRAVDGANIGYLGWISSQLLVPAR
jgi:hypothetical protein